MRRQPVSTQSTGGQSILDDIGGIFSKLWHGVTSFFSSLFGGDKSNTSATTSDDDSQADTPSSSRQTNTRGQRHGRRQEFSRAANNNAQGSMYPGASFASMSNGDYFNVSRVSSRFNGNSFGFGGRESFAPAFAGHGGGFGGGMRFQGGGMHCHGGGRHR